MVSRREFLRRYLLYALGGAAVASCAPRETPPTAGPTAAAELLPSPVPTSLPLPSATTVPPTATAEPTATQPPLSATPAPAYMAVVRGEDAAKITRSAVDAIGGIGRFVKKGDDVIVKPNICSASFGPEYASTTNPVVVATLVSMCLEAGASRVRVMDLAMQGTSSQAYKISGIREAVEKAGGQMELMNTAKYGEYEFPNAKSIKTWQVYEDVMKTNVLINVPIAKHHSAAKLSIGMKNLMGVVLKRAEIHWSLDQRIADLSTLIKPAFTLVDGTRVLLRHGPVSGNLDDVKQFNTLIASQDIVAADAYAAQQFFNQTPDQIGYIRIGAEMGLGRIDLDQLDIKEL